jgi:transcriptional regulator with XRE-family HTH domain
MAPSVAMVNSSVVDYSGRMATKVNALDQALAARLKLERESRSWSAAELAVRSGVSKAMISKIERAQASPTAQLLGRLSGAFGLTLSTLLARAEGPRSRLLRMAEQPLWQDPETGFRRRAVSPAGSRVIEIIHGELPPGARIAYPASAFAFIDQQIWVLAGTLHFTEAGTVHELAPGDCLELGQPADCAFENKSRRNCAYVVVLAKRG